MSDQELIMKKRALSHIRLDLAKKGISADPYLRIEEEDLVAEIRAIEKELGIAQTPTIRERLATPVPPRFQAQPEPDVAFHQRMDRQATGARQSDIAHQTNLLNIHRRNLAHYRAQARLYGSLDAAPAVTRNSMIEQTESIARIKDALRSLGQAVDDLPGDE